MRTIRLIRNLAFLALVLTFAWADRANLIAHSGASFCTTEDYRCSLPDCQDSVTWNADHEDWDCIIPWDYVGEPAEECYDYCRTKNYEMGDDHGLVEPPNIWCGAQEEEAWTFCGCWNWTPE